MGRTRGVRSACEVGRVSRRPGPPPHRRRRKMFAGEGSRGRVLRLWGRMRGRREGYRTFFLKTKLEPVGRRGRGEVGLADLDSERRRSERDGPMKRPEVIASTTPMTLYEAGLETVLATAEDDADATAEETDDEDMAARRGRRRPSRMGAFVEVESDEEWCWDSRFRRCERSSGERRARSTRFPGPRSREERERGWTTRYPTLDRRVEPFDALGVVGEGGNNPVHEKEGGAAFKLLRRLGAYNDSDWRARGGFPPPNRVIVQFLLQLRKVLERQPTKSLLTPEQGRTEGTEQRFLHWTAGDRWRGMTWRDCKKPMKEHGGMGSGG